MISRLNKNNDIVKVEIYPEVNLFEEDEDMDNEKDYSTEKVVDWKRNLYKNTTTEMMPSTSTLSITSSSEESQQNKIPQTANSPPIPTSIPYRQTYLEQAPSNRVPTPSVSLPDSPSNASGVSHCSNRSPLNIDDEPIQNKRLKLLDCQSDHSSQLMSALSEVSKSQSSTPNERTRLNSEEQLGFGCCTDLLKSLNDQSIPHKLRSRLLRRLMNVHVEFLEDNEDS